MAANSSIRAPAPRTTVVIVTYRSRATIDEALEALRECHEAGIARVVVVDNASDDGVVEHVRQHYSFVEIREPGANLGFARACNWGAGGAETDFLLFLNPDAVLDRLSLHRLVTFMDETPSAGIVAPAIPGQRAGNLTRASDVLRQGFRRPAHREARYTEPGGSPFRTTWVCGAAMMIRTHLFRELGGFDPRFFLYFEETDLCRRALDTGAEIWVVQQAVAEHQAGSSARQVGAPMHSGMISQHYYQSRFYYLCKHYGVPAAVATELLVLLPEVAASLRHMVRGETSHLGRLGDRLANGLLRLPRRVSESP